MIAIGIGSVSDSWALNALFEVIVTYDTKLKFQHIFGAEFLRNQEETNYMALTSLWERRVPIVQFKKNLCSDLTIGLL